MEEKKLTAEYLKEMVCNAFGESVVEGNGKMCVIPYQDLVNVIDNYECKINRLQAEKAEYERKLSDGELVSKEWHDEQVLHDKEEIERLKTHISAKDIADEHVRKMRSTDLQTIVDLQNEKTELQKQVDELNAELEKAYEIERANIQAEIAEAGTSCHWCEQQTVKDTAKEILTEMRSWVLEHKNDKTTDSFGERPLLFMEAFGLLFAHLKERYGVEVE